MLKTISAALLAVSVIAAPAFAATTKVAPAKARALNAHAEMIRHHKHPRHHVHHRMHAAKGFHHTHLGFGHVTHTQTRRG